MFIFHTDDVSLPSSWLHFRLVEANFPHSLTNQKHYTDLGRLVMHHQNRISALASHRSFHRESSDDVTKCWLFSQANSKAIPGISLVYKFIQVFFIWKLLCPNFNKLKVLFPGLELNFKTQFPTKFANSQKELFKNIFMTYCSQ